MDNELFELCKEVYEKTGWDYRTGALNDKGAAFTPEGRLTNAYTGQYPLYNSDYLADKLPSAIDWEGHYENLYYRKWSDNTYSAYYADEDGYTLTSLHVAAETLVKTLLKLTLALVDANQLKKEITP